jgi:hypothetical protein
MKASVITTIAGTQMENLEGFGATRQKVGNAGSIAIR